MMSFLPAVTLGAQIIFQTAKAGQLLPRFSILFVLLLTLRVLLFNEFIIKLPEPFKKVSHLLILICFLVNVTGYALLIALYRYSVQTIFNRQLPPTLKESLPSFSAHLSMLRPLEIIFRFLTSSWRVLPDIIVLGEVRCGTTSLCQHLVDFEFVDCHPPFCPWAHPELDNKETFFFVGHYLGIVTPRHYRMCFPLKITKWWNQTKSRILGEPVKPFLSFDGCAQYLTSPTTAYLIAKAYREAGQKPPVLIACVRKPVDQALSWWKYENSAIKWGEGMMLKKWNTALRGELYPPRSLEEAINYARSHHVENLYQRAERFVVETVENPIFLRLPQWSVTWPGAQLGAIGRNSCFASNIYRYERVFSNSSNDVCNQPLKHVSIFPMEFLRDERLFKGFLAMILERVAKRNTNESLFENAVHMAKSSSIRLNRIHRNASTTTLSQNEQEVQEHFRSKFTKDEDNLNTIFRLNGIPMQYD